MTAQGFNEYRIIPRFMGLVFLYLSVDVWMWYSTLDVASNADSATVIGVLGCTTGFCKFYMESGGAGETRP